MFALFSFYKNTQNVPLVLFNGLYFLHQIYKFYFNENKKNDVDYLKERIG